MSFTDFPSLLCETGGWANLWLRRRSVQPARLKAEMQTCPKRTRGELLVSDFAGRRVRGMKQDSARGTEVNDRARQRQNGRGEGCARETDGAAPNRDRRTRDTADRGPHRAERRGSTPRRTGSRRETRGPASGNRQSSRTDQHRQERENGERQSGKPYQPSGNDTEKPRKVKRGKGGRDIR